MKKEKWFILWRIVRPLMTFLPACILTLGLLLFGFAKVKGLYWDPVDQNDNRAVTITISSGSSVSSIARKLKEAGLIRSKPVFQYYADFSGKGHKLKAGTYQFSKAMSYDNIIALLCDGDGGQETMKFTLTEGLTIEQMAASLVEQGVLKDNTRFLSLCKTGEGMDTEFEFVQNVLNSPDMEKRRYILEGYLFPDTYEIYVGASEETILKKMLARNREILNVYFYDDIQKSGLNVDEVLTLASIIEKEARTEDFARVSAVFHNRLKRKDFLGSDVTVQYAAKVNSLLLTSENLATDSLYNTYKYKGLPLGPICAPSRAAIYAALHPDEEMKEMYYFCLTDPETGEMVFAKTDKEHMANVEQWSPVWRAYEEKHKNSNT